MQTSARRHRSGARPANAYFAIGGLLVVFVVVAVYHHAEVGRTAVAPPALATPVGHEAAGGAPPLSLGTGVTKHEVEREAATGGSGSSALHLLVPHPTFEARLPRSVAAALGGIGSGKIVAEGSNSAPVDEEDLTRARTSFVVPPTVVARHASARAARLLDDVYNAVAPFLVDTCDDAAPFYVAYGGESLAGLVASRHSNATVVVVTTGDAANSVESVAAYTGDSVPPNMFGLHRAKLDAEHFAPWFKACHFVTASLLLQRATTLDRALALYPSGKMSELVMHALPASRHMYAALLPSELQDVEEHADPESGVIDTSGIPEWKATVDLMRVRIRRIAVVFPTGRPAGGRHLEAAAEDLKDDSGAVAIVEIVVLESTRACAKTWGAPLIQWGRRLMASVREEGKEVSFAVRSVKDDAAGQRLGRTIHPLQYIPSVNLDTLLGAGLPEPVRLRLLGAMVATPRYSDPLPHNWVVGLGGRVLRIDKVDVRYDQDVDETKGYWGVSTRGYMHLLAHHLCVPVGKDGVPAAFAADASNCHKCWKCCSYLPKAKTPCTSCLQCAAFVQQASNGGAPNATVVLGSSLPRPLCQKTYGSMHAARRVWAKWRTSDNEWDKTHAHDERCLVKGG